MLGRLTLLLALLLAACSPGAAPVLPDKKPNTLVHDYVGVIGSTNPNRVELLSLHVDALNKQSGVQLVAVVVKDMGGRDVETFSADLFNKWGIGRKGEDQGALLVISMREKKVRLEVGYGAEAVIPDQVAMRIVEEAAVPALKRGDVYDAILRTARAISQLKLKGFGP